MVFTIFVALKQVAIRSIRRPHVIINWNQIDSSFSFFLELEADPYF
jgi:hypothetical protein